MGEWPLLLKAETKVGYNKPMNCKLCIGGITQAELVLKYVADYVNVYHRLNKSGNLTNTFGLAWVNSLTHDFLNWPKIADSYFAEFLLNISQSGALNNTILFFVSDHGIRWGKIVSTEIGRHEERLPFAFIVLPPSFKDHHPKKVDNLKLNSHRLTTPYDVHATLQHILQISNDSNYKAVQSPGESLLNEISTQRTCKDVGIADMWCSCARRTVVDRTSMEQWRQVHDAATTVLRTINEVLSNANVRHLCQQLHLERVMSAYWLLPTYQKNDKYCKDNLTECTMSLVLETRPGYAQFEVIVARSSSDGRRKLTVDDISRLNLYGNTSSCVHDRFLKNICYCFHQPS